MRNKLLMLVVSALAYLSTTAANAVTARATGTITAEGTGAFAFLSSLSGQRFTLDYSAESLNGVPCTFNIQVRGNLCSNTIPEFKVDGVRPQLDNLMNADLDRAIQQYENFGLQLVSADRTLESLTVYSPSTNTRDLPNNVNSGGSESFNFGFYDPWSDETVDISLGSRLLAHVVFDSADITTSNGRTTFSNLQFSRIPGEASAIVELSWQGFDTYTFYGRIDSISYDYNGTSAELPLAPTFTLGGSFGFITPVVKNVPTFFDPPVSIGYDYAVTAGSPLIAMAMFPTLLGDIDGFDVYTLGGGSLLFGGVLGGQWVDFTSLSGYANGVSGFSLRGINPALELDPASPTAFVTGLTFATSGTVNLTQTPVTIEWPIPGGGPGAVPEPASWALMIAGFGLVGATMRRRRRALA